MRDKKAKALGAKKVAKDMEEAYYDPTRKDNILGRKKTRLELWEEHLEDPVVALDKASARSASWRVAGLAMALQHRRSQDFAKDVGRAVLGRHLALLGPVGQRAHVHSVHLLERSREVWAAWRALFLPYEEGVGGGFDRGVCGPRLR